MSVEELINKLSAFPADFQVYAINDKGVYRRVEKVEADDHYPDVLIVSGDEE